MASVKFNLDNTLLAGILFYLILSLFLSAIFVQQINSNDIWKALYTGKYIWLFHKLPNQAAFSFSPVVNFLPRNSYNWLGNLILHHYNQAFGLIGFQVFRNILLLSILLLVHSLSDWKMSPLVLCLFILLSFGIRQKLFLRTAIFGAIGLASLLFFWFKSNQQIRYLYFIPLVLAIWGNLHGSFLVGTIAFLILLFGDCIDTLNEKNFAKRFVINILLISLAIVSVSVIKPHYDNTFFKKISGISQRAETLITFQSNPSISSNQKIKKENSSSNSETFFERISVFFSGLIISSDKPAEEMRSPFEVVFLPSLISSMVLALLALTFLILSFEETNWSSWFILFAGIYLGFGYVKTVPYMAITSIFVIFGEDNGNLSYLDSIKFLKTILYGGLFLLLGISMYLVPTGKIGNLNRFYFPPGVGKTKRLTDEIPNRVLRNYTNERFFNIINNGAFLSYKWWPFKRVFIDTKMRAYKRKFIQSYLSGDQGLLREANINHAIVPPYNIWSRTYFSQKSNWKIKLHSPAFVIYSKVKQLPLRRSSS